MRFDYVIIQRMVDKNKVVSQQAALICDSGTLSSADLVSPLYFGVMYLLFLMYCVLRYSWGLVTGISILLFSCT